MLEKVILPQRIKSDVIDGAVSTALVLVPVYAVYALAEHLAEPWHRLSIVGIPAALIYVLFRDSLGGGTSFGKKALGLIIVDLRTGRPCDGRRVLARNVIDVIPLVDLLDFLLTCLDARGQKIMDKILNTQVTQRKLLTRAEVMPDRAGIAAG